MTLSEALSASKSGLVKIALAEKDGYNFVAVKYEACEFFPASLRIDTYHAATLEWAGTMYNVEDGEVPYDWRPL